MSHHFTDDELVDIINGTGLRSVVMRDNGPGHDRIDLLLPHMDGHSYRFERDATGHTYLLHSSPSDLKLITSGTLDDCLENFVPRLPATASL